MKKRLISGLLAAVMILSSVSVSFAGGGNLFKRTLNYTHIGDSTSTGFAFKEYLEKREGLNDAGNVNVVGFDYNVKNTYADLVGKYLQAVNPTKKVITHNIATSGFRTEELCEMLYGKKYEYISDLMTAFTAQQFSNGFTIQSFFDDKEIVNKYKEYIKDADVLTLQLGMNNFTAPVFYGIKFGTNNLDDLLEREGKTKLWNAFKCTTLKEIKLLTGIDLNDEKYGKITNAVDVLIYSYWSFMESFDMACKKIYRMNPDVDMYVIGIANINPNLVLDENMAINVPYGFLNTIFRALANRFLESFAGYHNKYKFIDMSKTKVLTFADEYYKPISCWDEDTLNAAKLKIAAIGKGLAAYNTNVENERISYDVIKRFRNAFIRCRLIERHEDSAMVGEDYVKMCGYLFDKNTEKLTSEEFDYICQRVYTNAYFGEDTFGMHPSVNGHKAEAATIIKFMQKEKCCLFK